MLFTFLHNSVRVWNEVEKKTPHQVPLKAIKTAFALSGADIEIEEIECILANLIYDSHIKGYIAHNRCVVLHKSQPFSKLYVKKDTE